MAEKSLLNKTAYNNLTIKLFIYKHLKNHDYQRSVLRYFVTDETTQPLKYYTGHNRNSGIYFFSKTAIGRPDRETKTGTNRS